MYTFFDKLITPERCQELNTVALKLKKENRLNYEADKTHYANS